jgi:TrmH family RNA methyltransferase
LVATFALPDSKLNTLKLLPDSLVLVLDRLRDPGNVGTLLRTADAVGAGAVLLLTPAADLYDPKTIRASMGSLFNLPVIAVNDPAGLFTWLARNELRVLAADSRGQPWTAQDWQGGVALVLGNEAEGLSADLLMRIEDFVALPIYGQAESLNVAVAGGVLMYAWAAANR